MHRRAGRTIRDVGDPDSIRLINGKLPLEVVRRHQRGLASLHAGALVAPHRFDLVGPHDPRHPMDAAGLPGFSQVQEHTRASIDAPAGDIRGLNELQQPKVLDGPFRQWGLEPSVVTRPRDP